MPAQMPFNLSKDDLALCEAELRKRNIPRWKYNRYMILVLSHQGTSYKGIENRIGVVSHTIKKWKDRYLADGLEGLRDRPRPGAPRVEPEIEAKICAIVQKPAPEHLTHWTSGEISKKTGVPERTVRQILARNHLKPHLHRYFKASNDPDFEEKASAIIGLYLKPPRNAVVLCVDEKSQIQALDRKQPNLPLKPHLIEGRTFEYKRNGVTNLFAAFNSRTGQVTAECRDANNQDEFIGFLNTLAKQYGRKKDIHVILDNLKIHDTQKVRDWRSKHPNWEFHFTPTYSSWLNQVEIWFSIISRQCIRRGVFHSKKDLIGKIKAFIKEYNKLARPFKWTYSNPGRRIATV